MMQSDTFISQLVELRQRLVRALVAPAWWVWRRRERQTAARTLAKGA